MSLRGKLILAQAPLAVALALVGVFSAMVTTRLGQQSRLILADNYRSVLAAEKMKESLERIDSFALFILADHPAGAAEGIARHRAIFTSELDIQEHNITEPGEADITRQLRQAWDRYGRTMDRYEQLQAHGERDATYFSTLQPTFARIKELADQILALNQDAMVRRSDLAERRARSFEQVLVLAVIAALVLGLFSSTWLTTRMLRPLGVVGAAVRRFGEGDLRARAQVGGKDEISLLAREFNEMADHLERYRKSSLGELLAAQQAAQAAIDALPDPVLLLDANGRVQGANAAASSLLRIDAEQPEPLGAIDPGLRAVIDRLRAHTTGGRGAYVPKGFEDAVRVPATADGERILLPRATPIYGESGTVNGVAIVLQDATRLFRFDELKNNLVATVAHEFRTPLTSLRMALHLCTEEIAGPLSPKQAELLFAAREDCERLQLMVDELLNLSRIESGRIELQKRRADPQTLMSVAVEVHRAAAQQAHVTVRPEIPPGLPDVFVDPDRIQLVFTNLISNAIRFTPKGSEIVVRVRSDEDPTQIRFEIVDSGPGIPVEHQAGLFEKFFRVPGSPEGGSGLGLFIAKGIIQAHGGKMGVVSAPGEGATFWFTVPTAPSPA